MTSPAVQPMTHGSGFALILRIHGSAAVSLKLKTLATASVVQATEGEAVKVESFPVSLRHSIEEPLWNSEKPRKLPSCGVLPNTE